MFNFIDVTEPVILLIVMLLLFCRAIKKELEDKERQKKKDAIELSKRNGGRSPQEKPDDVIFVDKHRAAAVDNCKSINDF